MKYLELDYRVIEGWDNYIVTSCGRVVKSSSEQIHNKVFLGSAVEADGDDDTVLVVELLRAYT